MSILALIVVLLIVGIVLAKVPMDATIRNAISVIVLILVIVYLAVLFGIFPAPAAYRGHW